MPTTGTGVGWGEMEGTRRTSGTFVACFDGFPDGIFFGIGWQTLVCLGYSTKIPGARKENYENIH
jgi:hypothetical protein